MPPARMYLDRARRWARTLKRDVIALWLAGRDRRVPWYAKLVAASVAAYALSPVDLIPDFIPILGYLDDLLIVPLGILLAVKLIPADLMVEFRVSAIGIAEKPLSKAGTAAVVAVWLLCALLLLWVFWLRR